MRLSKLYQDLSRRDYYSISLCITSFSRYRRPFYSISLTNSPFRLAMFDSISPRYSANSSANVFEVCWYSSNSYLSLPCFSSSLARYLAFSFWNYCCFWWLRPSAFCLLSFIFCILSLSYAWSSASWALIFRSSSYFLCYRFSLSFCICLIFASSLALLFWILIRLFSIC